MNRFLKGFIKVEKSLQLLILAIAAVLISYAAMTNLAKEETTSSDQSSIMIERIKGGAIATCLHHKCEGQHL
ncbi:MAG: hypothetical protein AAGB01_00990 [Cyanobacteria bacterium P01_F01_bin.42]